MDVDINENETESILARSRMESSDGEEGETSGASTPSIDESSSTTMASPPSSPPPSITPTGRSTPPPTYEQCMKDAIPLSFVDFWPHCLDAEDTEFIYARFESFDRVVEDANRWLKQHPGLVVRNCETVELKVATMDDYTKATSTKASVFKSRFRPTLYIKGLRVWYSSMIINKLPCSFATTPCTLAYLNVRPSQQSITDQCEYETFSAVVEKCNNLGRCGVFSGRVLTAETVTIKEPEHEQAAILNMSADLDQTAWRDTYSKVALQFLRVFYLPEQTVREELCFKDFLPEFTRKNNKSQLKYKDFSSIMDDCRLWLLQHLDPSHRVLNAQTVETKCTSRSQPPDTDQTFLPDLENSVRLRFLRVYYVKLERDFGSECVAPLLMHRTFIPMTLRRRQHENMASLMQHVETWLRVTGANVVCAETVPILEQTYHDKGFTDSCIFKSEWVYGCSDYDQQEPLLYCLRVYLDTVYPEPAPERLDPSLRPDSELYDEDCVIL